MFCGLWLSEEQVRTLASVRSWLNWTAADCMASWLAATVSKASVSISSFVATLASSARTGLTFTSSYKQQGCCSALSTPETEFAANKLAHLLPAPRQSTGHIY